MNSPSLTIQKLEELAKLAYTANTDYEKAAIFAATSAITRALDNEYNNMSENIERARWSICAMVSYDVTNGHTNDMHYSWATSAIATLQEQLKRI